MAGVVGYCCQTAPSGACRPGPWWRPAAPARGRARSRGPARAPRPPPRPRATPSLGSSGSPSRSRGPAPGRRGPKQRQPPAPAPAAAALEAAAAAVSGAAARKVARRDRTTVAAAAAAAASASLGRLVAALPPRPRGLQVGQPSPQGSRAPALPPPASSQLAPLQQKLLRPSPTPSQARAPRWRGRQAQEPPSRAGRPSPASLELGGGTQARLLPSPPRQRQTQGQPPGTCHPGAGSPRTQT
mmetsp:Transcript_1463/g.4475  ORF Transcript_1463/g.4475 Transcript_1463/m.4475 type:complete len:242 (+) Transcript_1463:1186-1911(+)